MRVNDCSISADGSRLGAITSDNRVVVYDFQSRAKIAEWRMEDKLTCVTLSHDGKTVLVSMNEGKLVLLDSTTGETVQQYTGLKQSEFVIRSAFGGANENFVISGSEGGSCSLIAQTRTTSWQRANLFTQIHACTSGKSKRVRRLQLSRHILPGLSIVWPGIRPITPCSLPLATTSASECEPCLSFVHRWVVGSPNTDQTMI